MNTAMLAFCIPYAVCDAEDPSQLLAFTPAAPHLTSPQFQKAVKHSADNTLTAGCNWGAEQD